MWEAIELMMGGTDESKENIYDFLISRYEAFKSRPGESISQVYVEQQKYLL